MALMIVDVFSLFFFLFMSTFAILCSAGIHLVYTELLAIMIYCMLSRVFFFLKVIMMIINIIHVLGVYMKLEKFIGRSS